MFAAQKYVCLGVINYINEFTFLCKVSTIIGDK